MDDPLNALANLDPSIHPDPFTNASPSVDLEKLDFLKTRALRNSIHFRERGQCFYCLRRTDAHTQYLDHVQPRVKAGCNSYRNLVSCCLECNSQKGEQSATDFFRSLYRDRRLTASEFHAGLRRLDALSGDFMRHTSSPCPLRLLRTLSACQLLCVSLPSRNGSTAVGTELLPWLKRLPATLARATWSHRPSRSALQSDHADNEKQEA